VILATQNMLESVRQCCQHQRVIALGDVHNILIQPTLEVEDISNYINQQNFRLTIMLVVIDDSNRRG
jgi:hypothetical protein